MGAYTFFNDHEIAAFGRWLKKDDPEMHKLLGEVNARAGGRFFVSRREYRHRPYLLSRVVTIVRYDVYYRTGMGIECQAINLANDAGGTVFGVAPRTAAMNFLMGFVNGFDFVNEQETADDPRP